MIERTITSAMRQKLHNYFLSQYEKYRDAVLSGERIAGELEIEMVERQENDLKQALPWKFDLIEATRPLIWFAANLRFPSGENKGQPLKLSSWQVWIIMVLFGWVDSRLRRRYVDAYIEIARKNGKSTWAAAILVYLAFASGERNGNPCYIAATTLDQAQECFDRAKDELPQLCGVNVTNSKYNKSIYDTLGRIQAVTASPKDGKLPHGTIIDEYHQHKDNELVNSFTSGNVSDPNALTMRITTAGTDLNGVCKEEHDKGMRVLSGELSIDRYFFAIFTIDETDDPADPECWIKANPNLNVSVDMALLKSRFDYSKSSAADMTVFKTKNLNVWCHSLARWANMAAWNERCTSAGGGGGWQNFDIALEGRICYGGLDLSSNSDFTAFTLDFPLEDGRHVQRTHCWLAEEMKDTIARQCRIPLDRWIQAGWVTATPGAVIDYEYVREYLTEIFTRYQLQYIAADRWKIEELVRIMPSWFVDVAYEFSQGLKTMSPSIQQFERFYLEGKIYALDNECVTWMMSCAEVFQDSTGNIKLVKPKRRTEARIDGVITSVMALDCALKHDAEPVGDVSDLISFF